MLRRFKSVLRASSRARATVLIALMVALSIIVAQSLLESSGPCSATKEQACGASRSRAVAQAAPTVAVSGNHLVTDGGRPFRLLGVNRDYSELGCVPTAFDIPAPQVFDGPVDQASVDAMKRWGINAVRVPLNEACWLNINRVRLGGEAYRAGIERYVRLLGANGIAAQLDLHLIAPGRTRSTYDLLPMPDADHAPAFWRSVARRFRHRRGVILDLYNEPTAVSWRCWRDGCRVSRRQIRADCGRCKFEPYRAVGMARLVAVVRRAGFAGPIVLNGRDDLAHWMRFRPHDPRRQLIASVHVYGPIRCDAICLSDALLPVAARAPVVIGELGEKDCAHGFIDRFMSFADAHGISYLGWTWSAGRETCAGGPVLIEDYAGTPTPYGVGLRDHLRTLVASPQTND
jgi:endoglucanase